jgi:BirA family biotin operon repressor/biotin-[acetyl-CoA-carboxylase] ligase
VDSTNNYAKEYMAKTSPKDGSVILADEQYAGRGQSGNAWDAEPMKNLTFSIIYHTGFLSASEQFYLNMAVSLGLQESVEACLVHKHDTLIKWPNDIYVKNLKIAGVLIENIIQGAHLSKSVIGIGLNVNQEFFPASILATSLLLENDGTMDRIVVLKKILERIEYYFLELRNGYTERLKKAYLGKLYRIHEWHSYSDKNGIFRGKITGISQYGNLLVETDNGIREYGMKEIQFEN